MRQKQGPLGSVEKTIKDIRRATRKRNATEETGRWLNNRVENSHLRESGRISKGQN